MQRSLQHPVRMRRGLTLLEVLLALAILAVSVQILSASLSLGTKARRSALANQELRGQVSSLLHELTQGTAQFDRTPQPVPGTNWLWTASRKPLPKDKELFRVRISFSRVGGIDRNAVVFEQLVRANQFSSLERRREE